ncbi:hypothetical protein IMG5_003450 [Ichthyophthirius multifiliis]|uniref:Aminotransferase class I/classII large domain-containing protein n=1 Tax=Ichthyophthirius multifiliis TaxID=5932 RepID=G0QJA3_ICHMU|nr:hypothetical protein IMG5_003450 [Ichthyophthirius multifiliis]EGR34712.1 hypothetical protein IMG5_003450 [Ichthyophthirius multifiliis]|eukprot:XP_004040016.1 hypothetical protein IMG5_003450 [Ichthyophthirius multifiliis]
MKNYQSTAIYPTGLPSRSIELDDLFIDYNTLHHPRGKNIFDRCKSMSTFLDKMRKTNLYLYSRRTLSPPGAECYGMDEFGEAFYGLNFASADYLGLSQSESSKQAAIEAAQDYGVNSCGSPLAFGGHKYYYQLIEELREFWGVRNVMILSTGWMAGFGAIKGLIKAHDHIVMDSLSHNCLLEGAKASTKNIYKVKHLCNESFENKIKELRAQYPEDGIFVITEGLFSMNADIPDLVGLQKICKKYDAFLMIDCAHDFGCLGPTGKGSWEAQGLTDLSNVLLMAGGSKCLSTNLGFIGCSDKHVIEFLKTHCTVFMFTNAVNPIQCNTALAQLRILKSEYGNQIRQKCKDNYNYVKKKLNDLGYQILGQPSPILIVYIGNEIVCRLVSRLMMDNEVHVNGIEYPVVAMNEARLRLNLQPQHGEENMDIFVDIFDKVFKQAVKIFDEAMEVYQKKQEKRLEKEETKSDNQEQKFENIKNQAKL